MEPSSPVDTLASGALDVAPRTGLSTPEEYGGAIFRWESAPDWVIADVIFGIRDGGLVFAQYTAIPPGYEPRVHDNLATVDWIVSESTVLPIPVRMKLHGGRVALIESITFGIDGAGEAYIDSLAGRHPDGAAFNSLLPSPGGAKNGACGAARVFGTCNDSPCLFSCDLDLPDRDPCDCPFGGFCTDGTAKIACNNGTCTRVCDLNQNGLCGCFDCNPAVAESCVAKVNSLGCTPQINWFGGPHLQQGNGFSITADNLLNNVFGIFIYSKSGPANTPFQGGVLCLQPPVTRTQPQFSNGQVGPAGSDCSGSFNIEFTPYILSGIDPGLVPGAPMWGQSWYRDPADPFGSGLTNALQAQICP